LKYSLSSVFASNLLDLTPNYCSFLTLVLAPAKLENELCVLNELAPKIEPLAAVLFWLVPLLKHLLAAALAENGCFLLINTL
jgi:hypothetical protein